MTAQNINLEELLKELGPETLHPAVQNIGTQSVLELFCSCQ